MPHLLVACIFAAAPLAMAQDQNIKAVPDPTPANVAPVQAERIWRWHGKHKRKIYQAPAENPPRLFARATFATNHPSVGVVAFCNEARGSYMPVGLTYFLDAGGVNLNTDYWKRGRKGWNPLHPGETGPWTEITHAMNYGYRNIVLAAARDVTGHKIVTREQGPAFIIEFSRDGTNVIGSISNGGGTVACGLVSLARGTVESDVEMSEADLARARAAGATPPKRPRHFTIRLCHALRTDTMSPAAFSNEVETLRLLGPNDLGLLVGEIIDPDHEFEPDYLYRSPPGSHMFNRHLGGICSPDYVGITNQLIKLLETQAGPLSRGKKLIVGTADEPHYDIRSLTNCQSRVKTCQERHGRDFVFDPADLDGYLATIEYRDKMVCNFYKALTDAARSIHTNILCAANIGISLVFGGNAVEPGTDPFRMADCKALAIGQTEDWCNVQRTRQFSSYMCDVYRAAYGRNGMDIEMCSIILSAPETGAKAFAEVGHGARALSFFCYGPHWLNGDNRNLNPAIYPVIRHFCEATAETLRGKIAAAVREAGVSRRIFTDNPLIEASLLENDAKSTIVLSNWTTNAHPRVAVTLNEPLSFKSVRSASGAEVKWRQDNFELHVELEIGWGDYIVME